MRLLAFSLLVAMAGLVHAQDGDAPGEEPTYQQLLDRYSADQARWREEMNELRATEAYMEARKERDREKLRELTASVERPDTDAYGKEFLAVAGRTEGDDVGRAYAWVVRNAGDDELVQAGLTPLLEDHLNSEGMLELMQGLGRLRRKLGADVDTVIAKAIDSAEHAEVKAWGLYWRAYPVVYPGRGETEAPTDAELEAAFADLDKVAELAPDTLLALKAQGPKFQRERLQIGMVAPDIVGEDLDGVEFKLSDYRGQVVVLDFWGHW